MDQALSDADLIFIAVSTPTKNYGVGSNKALDITYVEEVTRTIANYYTNLNLTKDIIIIEKSTVPVNTAQLIK